MCVHQLLYHINSSQTRSSQMQGTLLPQKGCQVLGLSESLLLLCRSTVLP